MPTPHPPCLTIVSVLLSTGAGEKQANIFLLNPLLYKKIPLQNPAEQNPGHTERGYSTFILSLDETISSELFQVMDWTDCGNRWGKNNHLIVTQCQEIDPMNNN